MAMTKKLDVLPIELRIFWHAVRLDYGGWMLLADLLAERGDPAAGRVRRLLANGDRRGGIDSQWFRFVEQFFRSHGRFCSPPAEAPAPARGAPSAP